ncbi:MAG: hypothetical protein CTY25_00975 [Methylobacterium sp.]|nr:MAG: hypothetical protein CTY25_00975 [Methylobacterium sp.]
MNSRVQYLVSPSGERLVVLAESQYLELLKGRLPVVSDPDEGELAEDVVAELLRASIEINEDRVIAKPLEGNRLHFVDDDQPSPPSMKKTA